jgi:hypothetical protein
MRLLQYLHSNFPNSLVDKQYLHPNFQIFIVEDFPNVYNILNYWVLFMFSQRLYMKYNAHNTYSPLTKFVYNIVASH